MNSIMYKFILIIIFFSSRRRHTRYWRDWSSDVCSSDLLDDRRVGEVVDRGRRGDRPFQARSVPRIGPRRHAAHRAHQDRKSVVEGKSVDLGGSRTIKKKSIHYISNVLY